MNNNSLNDLQQDATSSDSSASTPFQVSSPQSDSSLAQVFDTPSATNERSLESFHGKIAQALVSRAPRFSGEEFAKSVSPFQMAKAELVAKYSNSKDLTNDITNASMQGINPMQYLQGVAAQANSSAIQNAHDHANLLISQLSSGNQSVGTSAPVGDSGFQSHDGQHVGLPTGDSGAPTPPQGPMTSTAAPSDTTPIEPGNSVVHHTTDDVIKKLKDKIDEIQKKIIDGTATPVDHKLLDDLNGQYQELVGNPVKPKPLEKAEMSTGDQLAALAYGLLGGGGWAGMGRAMVAANQGSMERVERDNQRNQAEFQQNMAAYESQVNNKLNQIRVAGDDYERRARDAQGKDDREYRKNILLMQEQERKLTEATKQSDSLKSEIANYQSQFDNQQNYNSASMRKIAEGLATKYQGLGLSADDIMAMFTGKDGSVTPKGTRDKALSDALGQLKNAKTDADKQKIFGDWYNAFYSGRKGNIGEGDVAEYLDAIRRFSQTDKWFVDHQDLIPKITQYGDWGIHAPYAVKDTSHTQQQAKDAEAQKVAEGISGKRDDFGRPIFDEVTSNAIAKRTQGWSEQSRTSWLTALAGFQRATSAMKSGDIATSQQGYLMALQSIREQKSILMREAASIRSHGEPKPNTNEYYALAQVAQDMDKLVAQHREVTNGYLRLHPNAKNFVNQVESALASGAFNGQNPTNGAGPRSVQQPGQ